MADSEVRKRKGGAPPPPGPGGPPGTAGQHPGGAIKHNPFMQIIRTLLLVTYFLGSCCTILATQVIGTPLYLIDRQLYYAYMALTKQSFGIIITTLTQWWTPTLMRVSGDDSVKDQLRQTEDGRIELDFPERLFMMANHQIYTEWAYLWWVAYTNKPRMHGHVYIMLKESLKRIPIIGWGMQFYGFIFMARSWAADQARITYRLTKLSEAHKGVLSTDTGLDPIWLIIFPEGTNLTQNTHDKQRLGWAAQNNLEMPNHMLLPKSKGTFHSLNLLKDTVDYVYDTTIAYEGIPRGGFGESYFGLRTMCLQGRVPPSVNMYWRRFALSSIPLHDLSAFETWLRERWYEKDALMEQFLTDGRFPGSGEENEYLEAKVGVERWWEVLNVFVVLATAGLAAHLGAKVWTVAVYGARVTA